MLWWVLPAPCIPHTLSKRRPRAASADPGLKFQSSQGNFKKSCILRGAEEGSGENVSETEIHQQDGPKETRCQLGTKGITGEDLVSEQKDEMAEFQRERSALQQMHSGCEPSRRHPLKVCSELPRSMPFTMGSLPTAFKSQLEGEFSRTS